MASIMNFGPQWLRTLSDTGTGKELSSAAPPTPPVISSFGPPQYKLAEHRYGREEMLALYTTTSSLAPDLSDSSIMLSRPLGALSMLPMSEEEQALLLSSVNSSLAIKAYGGPAYGQQAYGGRSAGPPSRGGGRGDVDRGRGRGRGRDDDSYVRRRDPWEDGFSRGGGKSYDRGVGYQNSSGNSHTYDGGPPVGSHRDYSRSMSTDNWREAKLAGPPPPEEERDIPRNSGTQIRGSTRNWREPVDRRNIDYDAGRSKQPPEGVGRRIDYKRSLSTSSAHDEDNAHDALPEWSTADAEEIEEGGSFDASGAFLFSKDAIGAKKSSNFDNVVKKYASSSSVVPDKDIVRSGAAKKNVSDEFEQSHSGGFSASGQGDYGNVRVEKSRQLTNSVEYGLSRLDIGAPFNHGSGRNIEESGGFMLNGPFSTDLSRSAGGSTIPSTSSTDSQSNPLFDSRLSESRLKREAESFVAQWTGGDDSSVKVTPPIRPPTQPASQEAVQNVPPVLHVDQWYYRDPQGDIQGPFKNSDMAEWFTAGYFTMSLLIRSGGEGEFTTLGDLIKLCGAVPFASKLTPTLPFVSNLPTTVPLAVNALPNVAIPTAIQPSVTPTAFNQLPDPVKLQLLHEQQQLQMQQLIISRQMQFLHAQQLAAAASGSLPGTESHINPSLSLGSVIGGPGMYGHLMQPNLMANSMLPNVLGATGIVVPGGNPVSEPVSKDGGPWNTEAKLSATREREALQASIAAQERAEQEREKERVEIERLERVRVEKERAEMADKEKAERLRIEQERQENERRAKERIEAEQRQKKKLEEEQRQKELREEEHRRLQDQKRQDMERQRAEEERLRLKKKEEERLLQEQQHWLRIEEQIKREAATAEEQRQKQKLEEAKSKQTKVAPWSNINHFESGISSNLEHIQKLEAEEQRQQQEGLRLQKMMDLHMQQQMQQAATWRERTQIQSPPAPSLLEIQLEQERQLKEERSRQHSHQAKSVLAETAFAAAPIWTSSSGASINSSSIWDNVDTGNRVKVPATPLNSAAQFPALSSGAKKSSQQSKPSKSAAKSQKEEVVVQKLFEANKTKDELTQWCETVLQGLQTSADIPTLVEFLKDIESPYEVHDYIKSYLGESKQVSTFAQQFLEKRSKIKNASKPKQEDSIWGPAHALNPQLSRQQQSTAKQHQQPKAQPTTGDKSKASASSSTGGGAAGKKKKKMLKVDSSILGFTVHADSERTNMGEIDRV